MGWSSSWLGRSPVVTFLKLFSWFFRVCFWIGIDGILEIKFGSLIESEEGGGSRDEGIEVVIEFGGGGETRVNESGGALEGAEGRRI